MATNNKQRRRNETLTPADEGFAAARADNRLARKRTDKIEAAYYAERDKIKALIGILRQALDDHDHLPTWGHVGSLGHVADQLVELTMFILPEAHDAKAVWVEDEQRGREMLLDQARRHVTYDRRGNKIKVSIPD